MVALNKKQILIGTVFFLIGVLVYITDRSPESTYFVKNTCMRLSFFNTFPNLFGPVGNNLPGFIHVFSFVLITSGLLNCGKKGSFIVCLFWTGVNILFEIGQGCSSWFVKFVPDWFSSIPFLENTQNYFIKGTFDIIDIVAILVGAVAALLIVSVTVESKKDPIKSTK